MNSLYTRPVLRCWLAIALLSTFAAPTSAQPGAIGQGGPQANAGPAGNNRQGGGFGNLVTGNGQGGAANADFDTLIDLIQSTVEPDTWEENGTGDGTIRPFNINGVWIDARGSLSFSKQSGEATLQKTKNPKAMLARVVAKARPLPDAVDTASHDARLNTELRYVSLPRLEAQIARHQKEKLPLEEAMLTLAGLQRVEYVLAYPPTAQNPTGDLVVAGPAGDWNLDAGGRLVSTQTGRPIVRLDDLLSMWRREVQFRGKPLGCSIVPRQEALARTQAFLNSSAAKPLAVGGRGEWLTGLRDSLGEQDVEFYHVDSSTRVARLLLLADYHMKLVGMGLAKGTAGVESYLDTVELSAEGTAPPMNVLRWWFALKQSTVIASTDGMAFAIPESCVQVLSENELLAARGERVHTGQSDELNRRFAESFTNNYEALAEKYPLYGELERLFELSLVLEVIRSQGLLELVQWQPSLLVDAGRMGLPGVRTPRTVETVINHRVIRRRHVIAGVSGGVWVDAATSLEVSVGENDSLAKIRPEFGETTTADSAWWWD